MTFKFEKLEVWQMSLEYSDLIYEITEQLPNHERFNLASQVIRAATSISFNIAEGSTGQSDAEQNRFLGMTVRSLIETVACQRLIIRRKYKVDQSILDKIDLLSQELAKRIFTLRKSLQNPTRKSIAEESAGYDTELF